MSRGWPSVQPRAISADAAARVNIAGPPPELPRVFTPTFKRPGRATCRA
eukprot:CAMPEP_0179376786 /NCGR_PEP_ID=MMETSP0797-20121207/88496_1 /TAXON_ID=47934 /ORGANISM="Dinophysis acuminata, Strain DAEP01" /LENGTH=48 /DNA_ID= /DNA_START= /DNA_END= /DNA_ORIENTATION=